MRKRQVGISNAEGLGHHEIASNDRSLAIATILAKGVLRWHRKARSDIVIPPPESSDFARTGLDFCGQTRLSVVESTRGLRLRDDGDEALC